MTLGSLAAGARRGEEPAEDAGEQAAAAGQPTEDGGEDQGHTGGRGCGGQWGRQGARDSDILLSPPQVPFGTTCQDTAPAHCTALYCSVYHNYTVLLY